MVASAGQRDMVDALADLCRREITPEYVQRCDEEEAFPMRAMGRLAEAGWAGLSVQKEYGGTGGSATDLALLHRTLARHAVAVAQSYYSLWVLGAEAIARLGTEKQRREWLPRIAQGSVRIAFALTEPGSGSDAAALRMTATRTEDQFTLSGQKVFITGAAVADLIITAARTTRATEDRRRGITLFLVDARAPGITVRRLSKLGLHALDLCEVFFADVDVPSDAVLGPLDEGWQSLRPGFALERTLLAAICVGALDDILAVATDYAQQRIAFGQPIGGFQLIADKLVSMRVSRDAADLLTCRAAESIDAGQPASAEAAIAKLFAAEAYVSAAREAVQIFGGYGYTNEYAVARHYRDAKFMEIGGGTSEIQKIIIARSMGLL
jgi:alkylation response protein AidB-like acyl-CoA dehydrogenase